MTSMPQAIAGWVQPWAMQAVQGLNIIPPSVPPSATPPSPPPAHWAWHFWSVAKPNMEQGVLEMQLATQSNCDPKVEQSSPAMEQVNPVHVWSCVHALSQGVLPDDE